LKERKKCYNHFKNRNKLAIDKILSTIILISFTIILSFIIIFYSQNIISLFTGFESRACSTSYHSLAPLSGTSLHSC